MKRVSVVLCTYNGEKYLQEQLDSIVSQSFTPSELVVCDDNSTDNTMKILKCFSQQAPFKVRLFENNSSLGVIRNFERVISLCKGDYVAFCDQDDVWMPQKLLVSMNAIRKGEAQYGNTMPLLVHTDLQVVNSKLEVISRSFMKYQHIWHEKKDPLKTLLTQNFVTGCSVLVNKALISIAMPIPDDVLMHDWWFALIAACSGKIEYIPEPTLLYRQHSSNVVGAKGLLSSFNFRKLLSVKRLEEKTAKIVVQNMELKKRLEDVQNMEIPTTLKDVLDIGLHGGIKAGWVSFRDGIHRQGILRNILYYAILIKGDYVRYLNVESDIL